MNLRNRRNNWNPWQSKHRREHLIAMPCNRNGRPRVAMRITCQLIWVIWSRPSTKMTPYKPAYNLIHIEIFAIYRQTAHWSRGFKSWLKHKRKIFDFRYALPSSLPPPSRPWFHFPLLQGQGTYSGMVETNLLWNVPEIFTLPRNPFYEWNRDTTPHKTLKRARLPPPSWIGCQGRWGRNFNISALCDPKKWECQLIGAKHYWRKSFRLLTSFPHTISVRHGIPSTSIKATRAIVREGTHKFVTILPQPSPPPLRSAPTDRSY